MLSVKQIVNRLKTEETALYALAAKQDFEFPADDSKPLNFALNDREALKDQANKLASEIKELTAFAGNLLTTPAFVARRSLTEQKNWRQQQINQPRLKVRAKQDNVTSVAVKEEPHVIDDGISNRPYDVFARNFTEEFLSCYNVPQTSSMKDHITLTYFGEQIITGLNLFFSTKVAIDNERTIGRAKHDAKMIAHYSPLYIRGLDDYLNYYKNSPINSELHPYCLSACRFCRDVIYPSVMERAEQLSPLLEQLKKTDDRKVLLDGLKRQGCLTGFSGVDKEKNPCKTRPDEIRNVVKLFPNGNSPYRSR